MNLGINEVRRKMASIPESEPLFNIIKSRTINTAKIKDKNERKYWEELKRINRIPDIYISNQEIEIDLKKKLGEQNGNKFTKI